MSDTSARIHLKYTEPKDTVSFLHIGVRPFLWPRDLRPIGFHNAVFTNSYRRQCYGARLMKILASITLLPPLPGSDSAPKSVVGVSHRVFHSRLKTHLLSRSFPP